MQQTRQKRSLRSAQTDFAQSLATLLSSPPATRRLTCADKVARHVANDGDSSGVAAGTVCCLIGDCSGERNSGEGELSSQASKQARVVAATTTAAAVSSLSSCAPLVFFPHSTGSARPGVDQSQHGRAASVDSMRRQACQSPASRLCALLTPLLCPSVFVFVVPVVPSVTLEKDIFGLVLGSAALFGILFSLVFLCCWQLYVQDTRSRRAATGAREAIVKTQQYTPQKHAQQRSCVVM